MYILYIYIYICVCVCRRVCVRMYLYGVYVRVCSIICLFIHYLHTNHFVSYSIVFYCCFQFSFG